MAETITIRTGAATDVIKVIEAGPQGPAGPAGTGLETLTTQGDLLYRGASAAARLGIGTAGQILKVNAGATAPEWGAAPASGVSSVAGRTGDVTLAVADVSGAVSTSDSRLTDSRTPSSTLAHKASHATGGTDALAPSEISAAWQQTISSITVSSTHQLTDARNQRVLVNDTASTGSEVAIFYPTSGNAEGDRLEVVYASRLNSNSLGVTIRAGLYDYTGSQSIGLGYQRTFIYVSGSWTAGSAEQHTHPDPDPSFASSAFRVTEPSGLATNQLAFSLANITAGATRTLTVPDSSGTIALQSEAYDFYYATAPSGATGGSGSVWVWNIPSWSTMQVITMIGAGGGGGSGRVGASGAVCGGGGGGGSGAYGTLITRITGGDQIEVLVGAGGAGGAAVGTATSNGLSGTTGGDTSVKWVTPNITLRTSSGFGAGVNGGGGGNNAIGTSGTGGTGVTGSILGSGGNGASGTAGSLVGNAGGGSNNNSTQGGRGGGSIDATPTAYNGGALLGGSFTDMRESFLLPNLSPKIGTGAKGGNASITANAQAGDNAGGLGGGGGGGGAALSGFLSGAGGNGGDGFVRINCF